MSCLMTKPTKCHVRPAKTRITSLVFSPRDMLYVFWGPVKILKIWTPEKFAVIILKFEQGGFTIEKWVQKL